MKNQICLCNQAAPGAIQPQCFSSFIPLHLGATFDMEHWVSREPCSSRTIQSLKPLIELVFNFPDRKIRFGLGGTLWKISSVHQILGVEHSQNSRMFDKNIWILFFWDHHFIPKMMFFFALKISQQLAVVFPGGAGYLSKFLIQVILNQICTSGGSTTRNGPRSNPPILVFFLRKVCKVDAAMFEIYEYNYYIYRCIHVKKKKFIS